MTTIAEVISAATVELESWNSCSRMPGCAEPARVVMARHILSTVHEDDDEPHTVAWLIEQGAVEQPNRTVAGSVVCSIHLPNDRRLHICEDGHIGFGVRRKEGVWAEGTCKTEGAVRQACKLLAIKLPTKST